MTVEVKVPTLGESVAEATIGEWLKQPGDPVRLDEPIASLETDKVAIEVPAPAAGIMGAHKIAVGTTVEVGAVIATIEDEQHAGETVQVAERENPQPAEQAPPPSAPPAEEEDHTTTLSPAVRRAVLEHGVDPSAIRGSGKDGRLTKEDVLAAAKAKKAEGPSTSSGRADSAVAPQPAQPEPVEGRGERKEERVKMTRLRQTIARR